MANKIISISYGYAQSPFGTCCIAWVNDQICALSFFDEDDFEFDKLKNHFPDSRFERNDILAKRKATSIFINKEKQSLLLIGTDFQRKIWNELLRIPAGTTSTYSDVADAVGHPSALRAVGTAIGANPIAYLVPCHRIIRSDGSLGGYRWGLEMKKKILASENAL
ncbi:MAG: hypothetical protein AUK44_05680 [Porphyromonadaceae bacterium CG2_30_38_12]|nr:MAG: hypothetical protein AUK44_05680 [Porphyromonadaceae bacterium CG2_30_38_12]